MILQALYDYYQRKQDDPDPARRLPDFGLEDKEIPFIVELTAEGRPLGIIDTRQGDGKKKQARRYLVPKGVKRASGVAANLLWDTAEYALGVDARGNPERVLEQHAAFRQRIAELPEAAHLDAGIQALKSFYANNGQAALSDDPVWAEIVEKNPFITFRLQGESDLICQRPIVLAEEERAVEGQTAALTCLITGALAVPERLESAIKGVWGAQPSGANIISFNARAFESYGKTERQGENAPVSPAAAFAYTTALNHLLDKGSRQRVQIGDASTVFWAQKDDAEIEEGFAAVFGELDDPDAQTEHIRALLDAVQSGRFDGGRGDNRFYVLGLAPNAARISVRFWQSAPIHLIAQRTREWFDDLELIRSEYDPPYPALKRLLASICLPTKDRPFGDMDRLPEVIVGGVMRAILVGGELPALILNSALQRCRADQARKDATSGKPVRHVSYLRAALIKAVLSRHFRVHAPQRKEISVSLDRSNTDSSYLRGRLFALYERVQEIAADRELNRTIRDSFFGAAMATPRAVFPRLVRLNQQHLRDLRRSKAGTAGYFDKELRAVNDALDPKTAFPAACALQDQGIFTLGYYHQRQDFFSKSESSQSTQGESK
jgi:CRISPR-associated protein Csd1